MTALFDVLPNLWAGPYEVTREYRTEIITSRSGKEQRRALRDTPRVRVSYTAVKAGDCLRDFDNAFRTAQRAQALIADRATFVTTTATLSSGGGSVTVSSAPDWLVTDAEVVLATVGAVARRTVSGVAGTTVSFVETDTNTFPAGSRLYRGYVGWLAGELSQPRVSTRGVVEAAVEFVVDPLVGVAEALGTAGTTLGGREVFLRKPDAFTPVDLVRSMPFGEVDYGLNALTRFWPQAFTQQTWAASYTSEDATHIATIRQFFDRMEGRRGEFYMPTWTNDLPLAAGITGGGTTMTVAGGDATAFDANTVYAAVAIRKTDQTWAVNTVTDIAPSGGNSVFTVGTAWGGSIALADVDMVCWMPVWRFASDAMTLVYRRTGVATARLAFTTIENLAGT